MTCEWCGSTGTDVELTHLVTLETAQFCNVGCLFHWIAANEPRYVDEVVADEQR
jgi:hypothetical protein